MKEVLEGLLEKLGLKESRLTLRDTFKEVARLQDPSAQNLSEANLNPYYAAFLSGVRMYGKDGEHRLFPTGELLMNGLRQEFPFDYPTNVTEPFFLFYRVGQRLAMKGQLVELGDRKVRTDNIEDEIQKLKVSIVETPTAVYATKPIGSDIW